MSNQVIAYIILKIEKRLNFQGEEGHGWSLA